MGGEIVIETKTEQVSFVKGKQESVNDRTTRKTSIYRIGSKRTETVKEGHNRMIIRTIENSL